MKWRFQTKWILHFLPLWVLGIAFLLPFVCDGIEFFLSCSANKKLLYAFQDSRWSDGVMLLLRCILVSLLLSLVWSFLAHWFWKDKDRKTRWTFSLAYFVFFLIVGAIVPNCAPDRYRLERMRRFDCSTRLKIINHALWMYADDHDNQYPDDLEKLFPKYLSDRNDFRCPSAKGDHGFTDYEYYGKGKKSAGPVFVILADKIENHRGDHRIRADSSGAVFFGRKTE